jgi:hypothetical protein
LRYQFAAFSGLNLSETRDISAETGPNAGPKILGCKRRGGWRWRPIFFHLLQVGAETILLNSRIAREALLVERVDERC